jgi:NitT/TauT family transport system permease protein
MSGSSPPAALAPGGAATATVPLTSPQGAAGPAAVPAVRRHLVEGVRRVFPPLVVFVILVGAWQACVSSGLLAAKTVSEPAQVARLIGQTLAGHQVLGATIWKDIATTLRAVAEGYAIGTVGGVLIGYVLGRVPYVSRVFQPYIQALAAVPKIALVPLFLLIFGIGVTAEMVNAALMVFIMVVFATFDGVANVNKALVQLAQIMGAKRLTVARRVVVPAALPSIFVGMRAGVSFAFIGAITSEFLAAQSGLGWMMPQATSAYDPTALFAGLVYLMVLVWALAQLVGLVERRTLRWQRNRQGEG